MDRKYWDQTPHNVEHPYAPAAAEQAAPEDVEERTEETTESTDAEVDAAVEHPREGQRIDDGDDPRGAEDALEVVGVEKIAIANNGPDASHAVCVQFAIFVHDVS